MNEGTTSLNATPSSERVHISIFGRRNSGKSSLINALTNQSLAIVSDVPGTTTDPVSKSMEILPIGPVIITDTAGIDDVGELGKMRVDQIAFMPALTFGGAVSMVVGQNIGAGRTHRANEVFRWGIVLCGGMTLAIAALAVAVPHFLLSIFLNEPEALTTGVHYLRIVAVSYVFFAVLFVANGVINGAGYTFVTTAISLVALWAARVPLAIYLSHRMHAVEGVFWAMTISNAVSMLISLGCYFSGFWKKPLISHHPPPEPAEPIEPFPAMD